MARQFRCPSCGSNIVTKHLKVGETAKCRSCGARAAVPESAIEVDDELASGTPASAESLVSPELSGPSQPRAELPVLLGRTAWDPKGLLWFSFFFTFLAMLGLAAFNWERLGHPEKKRKLLLIAVYAFPLWLAALFVANQFLPHPLVTLIVGVVNYGVGYHLKFEQTPVFQDFLRKGGAKQGYGVPVVGGLIFVGCLVAAMVGIDMVEYSYREASFKRGCEALAAEDYSVARDEFSGLRDYYEDSPELWFNLGVAYLNLNLLDSAGAALTRGRELAPEDLRAKELLTHLHEELGWHPVNGQVFTWHPSGEIKVGCSFSNGQMHGIRTEHWSNGALRRTLSFANGVLDGPFEIFDREGARYATGELVNGDLHGPTVVQNPESGEVDTAATYDHGVLLTGIDMSALIDLP